MFTYEPYFLPLYECRSSYQMVYRTTVLVGFLPRNSTNLCFVSILLSVVCVAANCAAIVKYKATMNSIDAAGRPSMSTFLKKRRRRVEFDMFSVALVVCFSLVSQAVLQALIMIYSSSSGSIRATCQDLRAFALDIAICCPPWILYYTTVHTNKLKVSTSSAVHSAVGAGAGAPPTKTHQMT